MMPITDNSGVGDTQKSQGAASLWLWIFFILGSGCLLYASVLLVKNILFLKNSASATGTVIDFHRHRGNKFTTYAPIVTFTTSDGRSFKFRSQVGGDENDYSIGQQVTVLYMPADPMNAEIKAFSPLWFPVMALTVIGLFFVAFSGGMMALLKRFP
jgi:hypothetical protein